MVLGQIITYAERQMKSVRKSCYSWVEHCDWIPFLLTGGTDASQIKRGVCSAGHKALWSPAFGGFPPDEFFSSLDPMLTGFANPAFPTGIYGRPARWNALLLLGCKTWIEPKTLLLQPVHLMRIWAQSADK